MTIRSGLITAFVKEVDAGQGRVKVEYRSIEAGLESPWAYVAAPLSGPQRGALFMPEPGDEVLVAFADGDFEFPYDIGFLWNGDQTSPETTRDNRVIVTPGGHQLRFEDKTDDTRVILKSNGGHTLTLEDRRSAPRAELETHAGRKLLLDDTPGAGKVQITSDQHRITMDDAPGGARVQIDAGTGAGVTIVMTGSPPTISITTTGGVLSLNARATQITTEVLKVNAALSVFSGTVQASTVVAGLVSSPIYV